MRLLLFASCLTLGLAQIEFCDSTLPTLQFCSDGVACETRTLDCSFGPNKCLCGSFKGIEVEFCDSTQPNQLCRDLTPCNANVLDCFSPTMCICAPRDMKTVPGVPAQTHPEWSVPANTHPEWQPRPHMPQASMPQVPAGEYCDSLSNQRCKDGTPCSDRFIDCQTYGPRQCVCNGAAVPVPARPVLEYCDATLNQRCSDGTPCTPDFLDCQSKGIRQCICSGAASATTASPDVGVGAGVSVGVGQMEFCNSLSGQVCSDGTPCNERFVDCQTRGPEACICPRKLAPSAGLYERAALTQLNSRRASYVPPSSQRQHLMEPSRPFVAPEWDQPPRTYMPRGAYVDRTAEYPPRRESARPEGQPPPSAYPRAPLREEPSVDYIFDDAGWGDEQEPMAFESTLPTTTKRVYCDSTKNQRCKDGTPCSPKFLDCDTKGLTRCICSPRDEFRDEFTIGSGSGSGGGDWEVEVEISTDAWDDDWTPKQDTKPKRVYCDSTKKQRCKDGTPCSPKFLDCDTKGPTRCICSPRDEVMEQEASGEQHPERSPLMEKKQRSASPRSSSSSAKRSPPKTMKTITDTKDIRVNGDEIELMYVFEAEDSEHAGNY